MLTLLAPLGFAVAGPAAARPVGPRVTAPSATPTATAEQQPGLTLVMSFTPSTVSRAGQAITYRYEVTNTSNERLTDVTVTLSPSAGALTAGPSCPYSTLEPGESQLCTATYTVTRADLRAGEIASAATATADTPCGRKLTSSDSRLTTLVTKPKAPVTKPKTLVTKPKAPVTKPVRQNASPAPTPRWGSDTVPVTG